MTRVGFENFTSGTRVNVIDSAKPCTRLQSCPLSGISQSHARIHEGFYQSSPCPRWHLAAVLLLVCNYNNIEWLSDLTHLLIGVWIFINLIALTCKIIPFKIFWYFFFFIFMIKDQRAYCFCPVYLSVCPKLYCFKPRCIIWDIYL